MRVAKFILFAALAVTSTLAQQKSEQQTFVRPQSRILTPLDLEPQEPLPQSFRRTALPLFRGRGFSLDGQEPKPVLVGQQRFPMEDGEFSKDESSSSSSSSSSSESKENNKPDGQLNVRQTIQHQHQLQQQQEIMHQQPPQFAGFRVQPPLQLRPATEVQPHVQPPKKVYQRPQKRVHVVQQPTEQTAAARSPEIVQRVKVERTESEKHRTKKPVAQVLRRYSDGNPDGSITWGYENDDGTFKEETIGVDCVTRGKYGYVDPEGVKREYSYQSGIPCDRKSAGTNGAGLTAVEEAQASDTHGYIDYSTNQYVMANGQTFSLNGMAKNRARKPVRKMPVVQIADHGSFDGK
ncbi:uncharacterized protein LOC126839281 [Adelges cooleyi]|uniref:uncharacterized protein LOC126839281 n=1 Tax=Adelges cooleyi TaxID=133065 RepID=UPI00217FF5E5|nr:uncharacterized protein LOC126839281 [Adelges cooleyi]